VGGLGQGAENTDWRDGKTFAVRLAANVSLNEDATGALKQRTAPGCNRKEEKVGSQPGRKENRTALGLTNQEKSLPI